MKTPRYLSIISLNDALRIAKEEIIKRRIHVQKITVPVQDSLNRITAEAVYAADCVPHYNSAAMDGIAVKADSTAFASETEPVFLGGNEFCVVDTGDKVPNSFDAVIMEEELLQKDDGYLIHSPASGWQHIRQIGEDICAGDMLVPSFTKVEPGIFGSLLASGVKEVPVLKPLRIGIIPTGDEIVQWDSAPEEGQIRDFNSLIYSAVISGYGLDSKIFPIVKDNPEEISNALMLALKECDMVFLCAGTSAGRDDYTSDILSRAGCELFHGIAIKPGKPASLAVVGDKLVFGIPGYTVSGMLVIENLIRPVIDFLMKQTPETDSTVRAVFTRVYQSSLKYREFIRVKLCYHADGSFLATPVSQGAGVITSISKADGIVEVAQDKEGIEPGETVSVKLLKSPELIRNTLNIIGSHDPLIDEISDLFRIKYDDSFVSSTHVGSFGGLMAVKRQEALVAGTHLLDTEDGSYNLSYVRKLFPDGDAALIRVVTRVQGFMTKKGNPFNFEGIRDLGKCRYVNRQKGSGTRVLLDYLLKRENLSPAFLNGYEREELTHTAVAAQIKGDTADVGLGIYSAAKIYDLSFIPVYNEEYDFLVLKKNLQHPLVLKLLDLLKSEELRDRLNAMGGYLLTYPPGEIRSDL